MHVEASIAPHAISPRQNTGLSISQVDDGLHCLARALKRQGFGNKAGACHYNLGKFSNNFYCLWVLSRSGDEILRVSLAPRETICNPLLGRDCSRRGTSDSRRTLCGGERYAGRGRRVGLERRLRQGCSAAAPTCTKYEENIAGKQRATAHAGRCRECQAEHDAVQFETSTPASDKVLYCTIQAVVTAKMGGPVLKSGCRSLEGGNPIAYE